MFKILATSLFVNTRRKRVRLEPPNACCAVFCPTRDADAESWCTTVLKLRLAAPELKNHLKSSKRKRSFAAFRWNFYRFFVRSLRRYMRSYRLKLIIPKIIYRVVYRNVDKFKSGLLHKQCVCIIYETASSFLYLNFCHYFNSKVHSSIPTKIV